MNIVSWNCRGLGNPRAIRAFKELIKEKDPIIAFVMETRMEARRVEGLKNRVGFSNVFAVNRCGRSGGLALFWDNNVKVNVKSYSSGHIDVFLEEYPGK